MDGKGRKSQVHRRCHLLGFSRSFHPRLSCTHVPTVTAITGKSITLTGRLQLWVFPSLMALRRPWLGYGLGAFWMNDEGAVRIQRALGWTVPHCAQWILRDLVGTRSVRPLRFPFRIYLLMSGGL